MERGIGMIANERQPVEDWQAAANGRGCQPWLVEGQLFWILQVIICCVI